jgi:short-subunit dehydrogenase
MAKVLVVGATSAIAQAVIRRYAQRGDMLCLVARDAAHLESVAQDARVRGAARVETAVADLAHVALQHDLVEECWRRCGGLDVALLAYGVLGPQDDAARTPGRLAAGIMTNFTSAAALLELLAARFEAQGHGTLAAIGSVAGDRGRQSNYAYGAAKGGLAIFLAGLRHRLAPQGVRVVTIKPGFVDTPMTRDFPKGALWASPAAVADGIVRALDRGTSVAYVPGFWRVVMLVVRTLPEWILHRTKL